MHLKEPIKNYINPLTVTINSQRRYNYQHFHYISIMKTNRTLAHIRSAKLFLTFIAIQIEGLSLSSYLNFTSFGRLLFISRRYSHNIRTVTPRNAFPERAVIIFNSLQQTKWICVGCVYVGTSTFTIPSCL